MTKGDRYDFEGADDGLDADGDGGQDTVFKEGQNADREIEANESPETTEFNPADIPLKFRRDGVKEFRPETLTVYMQEETLTEVRQVMRVLEDEFEDNVHKLDVYEAIIANGLTDIEGCVQQMEQFGYGMKE